MERIRNDILESIALKEDILSDNKLIQQINSLSTLCVESLSSGNKVIFCGNGGSFADAQHLSAELLLVLDSIGMLFHQLYLEQILQL